MQPRLMYGAMAIGRDACSSPTLLLEERGSAVRCDESMWIQRGEVRGDQIRTGGGLPEGRRLVNKVRAVLPK